MLLDLSFFNELDEKVYLDWQTKVQDILRLLQEGFDKINFGVAVPLEIQNIRDTLKELEEPQNITKDEYLNHIKFLKENLEALALKKDFNDAHVNHFIFQSRRSINRLCYIRKYSKYFESVLNPSGIMAEQRPRSIKNLFTKKVSETLFKNFDEEVTDYLKIQVQNLQVQTKIEPLEVQSKVTQLEQIMGKENYEATQSQKQIKSPTDVASYVSEQIYGRLFETYYTQLMMMQDIQAKINKLSEKGSDVESIKKIKEDLLNKAGFAELDIEASNYLNNIAEILGFENTQILYKNYQTLDTQEGFEQFKEIKEKFVAKKSNVLKRINEETKKEHERIKEKLKTSQINHKSATYAMTVSSLATDIKEAIDWSKTYQNIALNLTEDFLPKNIIGENPGYFSQLASFVAKSIINKKDYKKYLDSFVIGEVNRETTLLSQKLQDVAKPINNEWTKMIKEQFDELLKKRKKILEQSLEVDSENFTNRYIESILANKLYAENFVKASQLFPDSPEYIEIKQRFDESKEKYNNYHDAFTNAANNKIYAFTEESLANYIENKTKKIQSLSNNFQKLQEEESQLNASIQREEASFKGKIIKWRDNIASFFGIKTKTMVERERKQKALQTLYLNIEYNQIAIPIQEDLLTQARMQEALIHQTNKLNGQDLLEQVKNLFNEYQAACHLIIKDKEAPISPTSFSNKLFADHQEIKKIDNKLNIMMKKLIEEQEAFSLEDIESIQQKIIQSTNLKNTINTVIAIPGDAPSPSFNNHVSKLNDIINEKKHIAQKELLDSIFEKVTQYFEINPFDKFVDPFKWASSQFPLTDLTDESKARLYQHIQDKTLSWFNKANRKELPIQLLQNIYLHLQMGVHASADNEMIIKHYQQLIDSCKTKINAYYNEVSDRPFVNLKEALLNLQANLVFFNKAYEKAKKYNESWIYSSFIDKNTLKHNEFAYYQQLQLFITNYKNILEKYLIQSRKLFTSLNNEELLFHIDKINENLYYLKQKKEFSSLQKIYEEILNVAHETLHHAKENAELEDITKLSLQELQLKYLDLKNFTENLNKALATPESFNPIEAFETYNRHITEVTEKINNVQNHINKLEALYEKQDPEKKLAVNLKKAQLEQLIAEFDKNQANYFNTLTFYANLAKGAPFPETTIDKKTLGKGLIIAIAYNNSNAGSLLDHGTQEPIDIFELSAALTAASRKGDIELVKKILAYRKDITFNSYQIYSAIREALNSGKNEVVQHLIFNTDYMPDEEAMTYIASHTKVENPEISPIVSGWKQTFGDADGTILKDLRQWFTFEYQLIDSLKIEYEIIKQKAENKIEPLNKQDISDIKTLLNKINRIENIIQHSTKIAQDRFQALDPERKNTHLKKWKEQIELLLSGYNTTLNDILKPPVIDIDLSITIPEESIEISQEMPYIEVVNTQAENSRRSLEAQISERKTKTPQQLQKFKETLNELINASPSDSKELVNFLESLLNKLARLNQAGAIEAVLTVCQDTSKQELMANALSEAIDAGSFNAVSFLIKKGAHIGHEEELMAKLLKIIQERTPRKEGELEPRHNRAYDMAYELLTHAYTGKLDENIIQILENMPFVSGDSKLSPVTASWGGWVRDNDLPKLEALRQTYVFAEKAYEKLSMDIYLTLQPLREADIDSLSALDADFFERQISLIESSLQTQQQNIEELKSHYQRSRNSVTFENTKRVNDYVNDVNTGWEPALTQKIQACQKDIDRYIKSAKSSIKQCRKLLSQKAIEENKTIKKRSLILSQGPREEKKPISPLRKSEPTKRKP